MRGRRIEPLRRRSTPVLPRRTSWSAQHVLAGAAGLLLATGFAGHLGMFVLVGLVLACASALSRWTRWTLAVPFSVLALLLGAAIAGIIGQRTGSALLAGHVATLSLVLVVVLGSLVVGFWPGRPVRPSELRRIDLIGFVPAGLVSGLALLNSAVTQSVLNWIAVTTDGAQHAWFIKQLRETGMLDYASNGYPRAWHQLVAISANAAGAGTSAEAYLQLAGASTTWALALLFWCVPQAVRAVSRSRHVQVTTAVVLTLVLMLPGFMSQLVYLAASTTLLAAAFAVLALVVAGHWRPERTTRIVATLGLLTAAEIQLWTPVAAVPAAIALALLIRAALARDRRAVSSPQGWAAVISALAVVVIPTVPALTGLLSRGGVSVAATVGKAQPPDVVTLLLVLPVVCLAVRPARLRARFAAAAGLTGALAGYLVVLIGTGDPTDLRQWYPVKMAWLVLSFALPVGIAGWHVTLSWALPRLRQALSRAKHVSIVIPVVILGPLVAGLVAMSPQIPVRPLVSVSLGYVNIPAGTELSELPTSLRLIALARHNLDRSDGRVVVPVMVQTHIEKTRETWIVARIMTLETGGEAAHGSIASACQDVRTVAGDPSRAVVVTALPPSYVEDALHRQGCAGVRVEQTQAPMQWQGFRAILDRYGTLPPQDEATP